MNPGITNHHRPMTGDVVRLWEALGCAPEDPRPPLREHPLVRPQIRNDQPVTVVMRDYDCLDPNTGVHYVRITLPDGTEVSAHGDDVTGAFVRVYGMDERYVRDMFARVEAAMPAFLEAIWRPTHTKERAA